MAGNKGQPLWHVIIEDKKEVWFVGNFAIAMGLKHIVAKWFPGYTGTLSITRVFRQTKGTAWSALKTLS